MRPVTKATVRYSDGTDEIYIEPCKNKMFRVSAKRVKPPKTVKRERASRRKTTRAPKRTGPRLTREVRVGQILEVINKEPGLSYGEIGRRLEVDASYVFRLIKEEDIDRNCRNS